MAANFIKNGILVNLCIKERWRVMIFKNYLKTIKKRNMDALKMDL